MIEYNPNLILYLYIIAGIITLITAVSTYMIPKIKKIVSLFYIRLGLICVSLLAIFEGLAVFHLDVNFSRISALLLIPATVFISIGITYTMKETYVSINLIFISGLGALCCYFAFQPGSFRIVKEGDYTVISWVGLFGYLIDLLSLIMLLLIAYWGFKTWLNCPFLIKRDANFFLAGIIIATIIPSILSIFRTVNPILYNILFFMISTIGAIIFTIAIVKEPKLLYILPFTIYRILVKDKKGYPLFDHDWSESEINEIMFTGFINAVQLMSEEVMHVGGLIDINLEKGMLILYETNLITVGLVASKSSKLLRDTLVNFSKEFEEIFEWKLKQSIIDMDEYDSAYSLIDKYFSNFPFRIIPSKKTSLLLSGKFAKIPLELENKLKKIFTDKEEYERIISEFIKSPACVPEEFFELYDELKNEIDQSSLEDSEGKNKKLENMG